MSETKVDPEIRSQIVLYFEHGLQSLIDLPYTKEAVRALLPPEWIMLDFVNDDGREVTQFINPDKLMTGNIMPPGSMSMQQEKPQRAANVDPRLLKKIQDTKM